MMAFVERPDMPKEMLGIPGLNPWNLLFINVLMASIVNLSKDKLRRRLPPLIRGLLAFYFLFIMLAFFREIGDLNGIIHFAHIRGGEPPSKLDIIKDDIFNTIKYAVTGILLFYGCDSKERFKLVVWTLLAMNFLLAMQIIKVMPIGALTDGHTLEQTAMRKIGRDIGYFRSDLSIFLGGAAWAIFCAKDLVTTYWARIAIYGASFLTIFAVALTGGRMGMGVCIIVGAVLAIYKWRKILILGPLVALIAISLVPSVKERFTQGFTENPDDRYEQSSNTDGPNFNSVTSGRTIIWPVVIDQIWEHPYIGQGRRSMQRSGLSTHLKEEYNETFPHPHNAYLELFLDNGFVLGLPILLFYFIMLKYAVQMLKVTVNPVCSITGGIAVAIILSFLVGAIGQQSFYPAAGTVGLWCAMGILIRIHMEYFPAKSQRKTKKQAEISWVQAEDMPLSTKQP
jgi:O-antigen ligase